MSKKYLLLFFLVVIIVVNLSLRSYQLSLRPMHCDEANQGYKMGILLERGIYKYDPFEHHGPTLYYATLPICYLLNVKNVSEVTEAMLRFVPVFFSVLMFPALYFIRRYLGSVGFITSSILLSVSHAVFFYSRYYIHETLFVLFAMVSIISTWRFIYHPSRKDAILVGSCVALAFATKETTILIVMGLVSAVFITSLYLYRTRVVWEVDEGYFNFAVTLLKKYILYFLLGFVSIWILFFSSFFTHWQGLLNFFKAFLFYVKRAEGVGSSGLHDKPWWYYWMILLYFNKTVGPIWSEAFIVIFAGVGVVITLVRIFISSENTTEVIIKNSFRLFLLIAFLVPFLALLVIPYKTPWNILFPLWGMIVFAGIAFQFLFDAWNRLLWRFTIALVFIIGTSHLAYLTYLGNFVYYADISNPYVYAHTTTSLVRMVDRIRDLSTLLSREHRKPIVFVMSENHDYWPLPWYLRGIQQKGFWSSLPDKDLTPAHFLIVSQSLREELDKRLPPQSYMIETYSLRPGVFLYLYIQQSLWDRFIQSRS